MEISFFAFVSRPKASRCKGTLPLGLSSGQLRNQERFEGAAAAAPYADGSRPRSDGPRILAIWGPLRQPWRGASDLDAVAENLRPGALRPRKREARNLAYSPTLAPGAFSAAWPSLVGPRVPRGSRAPPWLAALALPPNGGMAEPAGWAETPAE